MSKPFKCPKCGEDTFSLENGGTVLKEGVSDPRFAKYLKNLMAKTKMKKYRFWRCEKCDVYYQTDLNGKLITKIPSTIL